MAYSTRKRNRMNQGQIHEPHIHHNQLKEAEERYEAAFATMDDVKNGIEMRRFLADRRTLANRLRDSSLGESTAFRRAYNSYVEIMKAVPDLPYHPGYIDIVVEIEKFYGVEATQTAVFGATCVHEQNITYRNTKRRAGAVPVFNEAVYRCVRATCYHLLCTFNFSPDAAEVLTGVNMQTAVTYAEQYRRNLTNRICKIEHYELIKRLERLCY